MSQSSYPDDAGWARPEPRSAANDDGWGPATSVRAGSGAGSAAGTGGSRKKLGRAYNSPNPAAAEPGWTAAGPLPGRDQRATRAADRRMQESIEDLRPARAPERGLPWWGALLLLIAIAAVGGVIDTLGSISVKGGFNIGIVAASVIAILAVRRSQMFPVVIAPPIVYSGAALFQLYVRSSGLSDRKVILDAAANYLVYGFPAIAAATAAVLIIAGIRLIVRK